MFNSLLIANRGEIACRIARTASTMGLRTIAVFSDADAGARHVRLCDMAVRIGPAPAAESYLDIGRIVEAVRQTGAEAVHPGYGFLAENADFAEACADAGLVFVGPPAAAMRAMAAKDAARRRMAKAGVPVTPGYDGDDQSDAAFAAAARGIGYPVLVKASAGGGGRGMRSVPAPEALAGALAEARAEARSAFGDDRLILERQVKQARHVEVQVFADSHGNVVHLFDRDCSVQRRRQKLVEEAPAPGIPQVTRDAMADAAIACARAIGYVNAGTVEFLLAPDGSFSFMEMNTRLQVEHRVTEAITGLDLVEWQLRVAAGEPLPRAQDQIECWFHAIECRVIAEDPEAGFAPCPGPIALMEGPHQSLAYFDTGYEAGDEVPVAYDSLLAKLVVYAPGRDAAVGRMLQALADTGIGPGPTNLGLLAGIVADPGFRADSPGTEWLEVNLDRILGADKPLGEAIALAAWWTLSPCAGDGWGRRDGWRAFGQGNTHLAWTTQDGPVACAVSYVNGALSCNWGSGPTLLSAGRIDGTLVRLQMDVRVVEGHVLPAGDALVVLAGGARIVLERLVEGADESAAIGDGRILAPLPGKVLAVLVAPDATVAVGDPLVSLEAMKMQHTLNADRAGRIASIGCAPGDQVARGDLLVVIEDQA